eukprot:3115993-Prymnesium_polylepis.1
MSAGELVTRSLTGRLEVLGRAECDIGYDPGAWVRVVARLRGQRAIIDPRRVACACAGVKPSTRNVHE